MEETSTMTGEAAVTKVEGGGEGGGSPERARRDLESEFNMQRAKMKELFLQKEEDMRRMVQEQEQLQSEVAGLRAELQQLQTLSENQKSEIQSLQMLVSETVEASSSGSEELRRLRAKNLELEQQLAQLRQQHQEVSLAPATFVRTLARRLGADTDSDQPAKKSAEEGEVRSLLQPLEQEVAALKAKLRDTDAQLQEARAKAASTAGSAGDVKTEAAAGGAAGAGTGAGGAAGGVAGGEGARACDMCANYERQLVAEQAAAGAARDRAAKLDHALKLATEELEGVQAVHDETVRAWAGERAAAGARLAALADALAAGREALAARALAAQQAEQRALERVTMLTVDREMLQKKLDCLEQDNAYLIGQYLKTAADMQNEIINLPDNVEELQVHALQLREALIAARLGGERAAGGEREARAQLAAHAAQLHRRDDELAAARADLQRAREELDRLQTEREQMKELADKLRSSNDMIERLLDDKKRLQSEVAEVRARVLVLQQELDNSEKVQQDFVRLSQSLQVQLQRIREADSEVRWQHDEDVSECPSCHAPLHTNKKKIHCRHCGRIFCAACVAHTVASGPRGAPARVCSVCRTLLQPHTAPYFSTAPPHSPD